MVHHVYIYILSYFSMNQKYSNPHISEPSNAKVNSRYVKKIGNYDVHLDHCESADPLFYEHSKSHDKIKNFITFLKLIDEKKIN